MPIDTKAIRNNWTVAVGPLRGADSTGTILALCDEVDRLTEALRKTADAATSVDEYDDGGEFLRCDFCDSYSDDRHAEIDHNEPCPIGIAERALKDKP